VGDVGSKVPAVSLDELIALNDEIAALARAGLPLESGLVQVGGDMPGRLRALATDLGEKMRGGESLPEALDSVGGVPPLYRAVVEAGLRAGRLPAALEGLAGYARCVAEARQAIGLAMWYPLTVVLLGYALFLFIATTVIPRFVGAFSTLGLPLHGALRWLEAVGETARYWGPVLPVAVLVFLFSWAGSRRAANLGSGQFGVLRYFPWVGSMLQGFEAAGFSELLAVLVEHGVPYPQALVLAGEGSGNAVLAAATKGLAEGIRQGRPASELLRGRGSFPPLLRWLLATAPAQVQLASGLRQLSARYRSRARHQAEKIQVLLPGVLLIGLGASATLLYALALFVPLSSLWTGLSAQAP
jgi:general secretion pathway protein F